MSEFKVGDRVKIREDLKEDEAYEGTWVTEEMLQYVGKIATIKWANDRYYRIDLDDEEYAWVKEFFEKIRTITLEQLEQRIEKLEKCVMGEQNSLEKCENVSLMSEFTKEEIAAFNYWKDENYKWACKDEEGSIHIFKIKPTIYNIEELLKGECGNEN